jgi:hypothetical protein
LIRINGGLRLMSKTLSLAGSLSRHGLAA